MPDDYYDEGSDEPRVDDQVDVPEEKLGLVPMSFFKNKVSPGDKEKIEVVKVYDDEVAIRCIYSKDKEESSEDEGDDMAEPSEAEADELMG
jgi:hypothetical protein